MNIVKLRYLTLTKWLTVPELSAYCYHLPEFMSYLLQRDKHAVLLRPCKTGTIS